MKPWPATVGPLLLWLGAPTFFASKSFVFTALWRLRRFSSRRFGPVSWKSASRRDGLALFYIVPQGWPPKLELFFSLFSVTWFLGDSSKSWFFNDSITLWTFFSPPGFAPGALFYAILKAIFWRQLNVLGSFCSFFELKTNVFIARCCKIITFDFLSASSEPFFSTLPDACFRCQVLYLNEIGPSRNHMFLTIFEWCVFSSSGVFIALCLIYGRQGLKNLQKMDEL